MKTELRGQQSDVRFGSILASSDKKVPDPVGSGFFLIQNTPPVGVIRKLIDQNLGGKPLFYFHGELVACRGIGCRASGSEGVPPAPL